MSVPKTESQNTVIASHDLAQLLLETLFQGLFMIYRDMVIWRHDLRKHDLFRHTLMKQDLLFRHAL